MQANDGPSLTDTAATSGTDLGTGLAVAATTQAAVTVVAPTRTNTPTNTPTPTSVNTPTPTNTRTPTPTQTNTPCPMDTIGDFIWFDSNSNGLQDAGEPGINGVKVNFFTCTQNNLPSTFLGQVTTQTVYLQLPLQTCTPSEQWLIQLRREELCGAALQGPSQTMALRHGRRCGIM